MSILASLALFYYQVQNEFTKKHRTFLYNKHAPTTQTESEKNPRRPFQSIQAIKTQLTSSICLSCNQLLLSRNISVETFLLIIFAEI